MNQKKKPKSRIADRNASLVNTWLQTAKFFARGGYSRVYRKKESNYPVKVLHANGELVKIVPFIGRTEAKALFWEMKIVHELFPENTLRPRGVISRTGSGNICYAEVHMDEVPVHKGLKKYQETLAEDQSERHTYSYEERERLHRLTRLEKVGKLSREMEEAGIDSHIWENPTNVSVANPEKPVFFEPGFLRRHSPSTIGYNGILGSQQKIIQYMKAKKIPKTKQKKVLGYFDNLLRLPFWDKVR